MQLTDGENLYQTVLSAPIGICILNAATLTAEIVNDKFIGIAGKPKEAILNKWYWEPFAEARPYYEAALAGVVETGEPYYADEVELMLIRHGREEWIFVTFVYAPVKNSAGEVVKVAVWVLENTRQVIERQRAETAKAAMQKERDRFNSFMMQAPAGICVLNGPDLVYEFANPSYQQLLPGRILLGRPIFEVLPEIAGTPIASILHQVYTTGEMAVIKELLIPLADHEGGPLRDRYFTFNYQARLNENDEIDGILAFVYEVTEFVESTHGTQAAYEQLRLSKEAAELGFFDMDMNKGTLEWDARCRELFGISHQDEVTYEKDFVNGLHPEDKERILNVIRNVFIKSVSNGVYDVEYRTVGVEDHKVRWVRAKGQAYFDKEDRPLRFIGSVLEITEQKEDELRKNDFIGMVSHELKTPLTSLTAIIQVAKEKLKNNTDPFIAGAMEKANVQVKRMGNMINGFLNISRLESAKLLLDKQRFDLETLIEDLVQETRLTVTSHTINFERCDHVFIVADRDKIGSVVTNLISNAVKYSPKGRTVDVECKAEGDKIRVSITDQGMGLKPQDKERVFDRYFRVENNSSKNISGFGIGLYLSAEIIRGHNGHIGVESESENGSTFYFTLPVAV
ncbi:PAS domain-containing protein [Mucilaginibacter mali]|uniref:histidine kinase n=1 Tax=Mucilaginibacter mali TaxID=2740462 RepID=A0A7D4QBQ8_9SPHI|nr:PAS domain-containing sensor histidine kinase [Mucilaginibacter mali]QKJ32891.1 PAS domain-containing protein [Mucilaginibacter mali]